MTTVESPRQYVHESCGAGLTRRWDLGVVFHDAPTAYQHVVIAETALGVTLFCDDDRQSSEHSQLTYHEALLVPALALTGNLDNVLIIGSSEGVACQIALQAGANHIEHVDIDREAVRLCAEYLPYGYSPAELAAIDHGESPIHLHYSDGWTFLTEAAEKDTRYDLIVIDVPAETESGDPQHNRMFQLEFLALCRDILAPHGVVATQAGCPTQWRNSTLTATWERYGTVFPTSVYYGSDEHEWAYIFGTADALDDPVTTMTKRLAALPYQPTTVDEVALSTRTVPPHSLRTR